jgi:hypothetical protein
MKILLTRAQQVSPLGDTPLFMQPVIWIPISGTLPEVLGRAQAEDDEFPSDYATKGLESLAKLKDKTAIVASKGSQSGFSMRL